MVDALPAVVDPDVSNTEHAPAVPADPDRRRTENLPPDPLEAFLNAFRARAGAVWGAANAVGRFARAFIGGGNGR